MGSLGITVLIGPKNKTMISFSLGERKHAHIIVGFVTDIVVSTAQGKRNAQIGIDGCFCNHIHRATNPIAIHICG